jgi:hypothetical protein
MCDIGGMHCNRSLHKTAIPLIQKYKYDVNFITVISDTVSVWTLDLFQQEDHNQEWLKSVTCIFEKKNFGKKIYVHLESFLLLRVSHTERLKKEHISNTILSEYS